MKSQIMSQRTRIKLYNRIYSNSYNFKFITYLTVVNIFKFGIQRLKSQYYIKQMIENVVLQWCCVRKPKMVEKNSL